MVVFLMFISIKLQLIEGVKFILKLDLKKCGAKILKHLCYTFGVAKHMRRLFVGALSVLQLASAEAHMVHSF
ncbi:hypothetical protein L1887_24037 [Cichorium endivia]|nr:hypothetical protein L1887_24037 [Cichorium endivia]